MEEPGTQGREWEAVCAGDHARRAVIFLAALLVAALAFAPRADAFVYWATTGSPTTGTTIGRANLNGTGANQSFITGASRPTGVAVDGAHIYWSNFASGTIGRANLNGTAVNQSFITGADANDPDGVAVDDAHVYWANLNSGTIGRANLNGTGVNQSFISGVIDPCGVAVDDAHVYWGRTSGTTIGRANLNGTGVNENFITGGDGPCGVAVDAAHVYWANGGGGTIGRANLNGTGANQSFITGTFPCGVAVDGSHVYWANQLSAGTIGRANLNGTGVNQNFITAGDDPCGVAVDALSPPPPPLSPPPPPSNDFSFGKVKKNKRKGTAKLTVIVPGRGELDLAKTKKVKGAEEPAEAAGKEKLPVKPRRKAKKKLNNRGKAKVRAKVTYTPDGGTPNTESKKIKLIKR